MTLRLGAASVERVEEMHTISPSLSVEPAVGHTVGHVMLRLDSGGQRAYFVFVVGTEI